jgi:predicted nuclease of predicted toxin-antitoxin system
VKFFLDHDVPAAVKDALARHGHEVTGVTDTLPGDSADDLIFATAQQNEWVMITCNRNDFLGLAKKENVALWLDHFDPPSECTTGMHESASTNPSSW